MNCKLANSGLSTKMARKMIFSMEKVVGSALHLFIKGLFISDKYTLVNVYVDLLVFTRIAGTS